MATKVFLKGDKIRIVREAVTALGMDCAHEAANQWAEQKYGTKTASSTFYRERRLMRQQAEEGQRQAFEAQQAAAEAERHRIEEIQRRREEIARINRLVSPEAPVATPHAEQPQAETLSVTLLVKAAKVLVARLGKDEAKQLIDAL